MMSTSWPQQTVEERSQNIFRHNPDLNQYFEFKVLQYRVVILKVLRPIHCVYVCDSPPLTLLMHLASEFQKKIILRSRWTV